MVKSMNQGIHWDGECAGIGNVCPWRLDMVLSHLSKVNPNRDPNTGNSASKYYKKRKIKWFYREDGQDYESRCPEIGNLYSWRLEMVLSHLSKVNPNRDPNRGNSTSKYNKTP
ncbi:hypothetical protein HGM15179_018502 [Zosterops borbonicus]|uniref:Uncharacterized protein n=1 Tax=Zosterops borbonicus TaxID=364589 RepID=A0A8K1FYW8_9PASS|nr:hypothetical protein HGM15179_018502 [Zosterops borbonicus]